MMNLVLERNKHTHLDRIEAFLTGGRSNNLKDGGLCWLEHRLLLEKAPEPNDVNWEFIHTSTREKIGWRCKSWSIFLTMMSMCFLIIFLLSFWANKLSEESQEAFLEHKQSYWLTYKVNMVSSFISWTIVLFNKFVIALVVHRLVDLERIST
jgi:hypothetical protein